MGRWNYGRLCRCTTPSGTVLPFDHPINLGSETSRHAERLRTSILKLERNDRQRDMRTNARLKTYRESPPSEKVSYLSYAIQAPANLTTQKVTRILRVTQTDKTVRYC